MSVGNEEVLGRRMATLEASVKRWRVGAIVAAALGFLGYRDAREAADAARKSVENLAAAATRNLPKPFSIEPGSLSSSQLELTEPAGRGSPSVRVGATIGGSALHLSSGEHGAYIFVSANRAGEPIALLSTKEHGSARLMVDDDGPSLTMADAAGNTRLVLGVAHLQYASGESVTTPPSLVLFDSKGHVTFQARTGK